MIKVLFVSENHTETKPCSSLKSSFCHEHLKFVVDIHVPLAYFPTFIQSKVGFNTQNCKLQFFLINQFYKEAY